MENNLILHLIQALLVFLIAWIFFNILSHARKHRIDLREKFFSGLWIGYVTDLFDTLGIGTFATTTALFKATKFLDDDRKIPATLNTAHVVPLLIQALCFITIVKVDITTLLCLSLASFSGAIFGARLTKNWDARMVQRVLGTLLLAAAAVMVYRLVFNPGANLSEDVRGLTGLWLVLGIVFDFFIGMLLTMGFGNFALELIFFSLLGINPSVAFPIMMLNASMSLTASSRQFIKSDRVYWPGLLGIIVGGILGVLTAAFFLKNLDINVLKILVVFIATFTGLMMLRASIVKR